MSHKTSPTFESYPFMRNAVLSYVVMAALGLAIMIFGHENLASSFQTKLSGEEWWVLTKCSFIAIGLSYILNYLAETSFASYRELRYLMVQILGATKFWGAWVLALASGFGEEILFRGALQPYLGLWVTSVIFGLAHLGPRGRPSIWSLAAGVMGLILGYIYQQTGNLWPVIAAHFFINLTSILKMQHEYNRLKKLFP